MADDPEKKSRELFAAATAYTQAYADWSSVAHNAFLADQRAEKARAEEREAAERKDKASDALEALLIEQDVPGDTYPTA